MIILPRQARDKHNEHSKRTRFQERIEAAHAANLLSDDEFERVEDLFADFAELGRTVTKEMVLANPSMFEAAATLSKLVVLSERMTNGASFARQVRRKHL